MGNANKTLCRSSQNWTLGEPLLWFVGSSLPVVIDICSCHHEPVTKTANPSLISSVILYYIIPLTFINKLFLIAVIIYSDIEIQHTASSTVINRK